MPNMTNIRKEDLSLYYYIKDTVLEPFIEFDEKATLTFVEVLSSANNDSDPNTNSLVYELDSNLIPSPNDRGRGWVYFDPVVGDNYCAPYMVVSGTRLDGKYVLGSPEQDARVVVYDADYTIIPPEEYMIDYIDCRVVTSGSCSPAFVDHHWNYVSVVDEWELLPYSNPPIVVVDVKPLNKSGYQLGGGKHVKRSVDLHIFASSAAERNDIVDTLYDGLYNKGCPIYGFPLGSILDYDGTWYGRKNNVNKLTSLFDREVLPDPIGNAWFDSVVVKPVERFTIDSTDSKYLDKLNRYRSKISFYMNYYTGY